MPEEKPVRKYLVGAASTKTVYQRCQFLVEAASEAEAREKAIVMMEEEEQNWYETDSAAGDFAIDTVEDVTKKRSAQPELFSDPPSKGPYAEGR